MDSTSVGSIWIDAAKFSDYNPVALVVTLIATISFGLFLHVSNQRTGILNGLFYQQNSKADTSDDDGNDVPMYNGTIKEFMTNELFREDSPERMLRLFQTTLKTKIFRAPYFFPFGLGPTWYIIGDYGVAKSIIEDKTTTKFSPANQFFRDTTNNGDNLITADGHRWKHVRKATSSAFSSTNIKLIVAIIENVTDSWLQRTFATPATAEDADPANSEPGVEFDPLYEMNRITSDVICTAAFDYELRDDERHDILTNLQVCWLEFGMKMQTEFIRQLPILRDFVPGIRKAKAAAKELYRFRDHMLQQYKSKPEKDRKKHIIIDMILNDKEYKDDEQRIRDMVAYVIAGFDSTANTLAFVLHELAQNQAEQTKLYNAVQSCVENKQEPRYHCTELKHVIKEALRMYPATALGLMRLIGKDLTVPNPNTGGGSKSAVIQNSGDDDSSASSDSAHGDIFMPKGSIALLSFYPIQRDPDVYDDPNTFRPSRWIDPTEDQRRALLTFSTGSRNCQGQALAVAELTEVVWKLIYHYELSVVRDGEPVVRVLFRPEGTILKATKRRHQ